MVAGTNEPVWTWPTNDDASLITGCLCRPFAAKVRQLGYTIGNRGYMYHIANKTSTRGTLRFDGDGLYNAKKRPLSIYGWPTH